MSLSLTFLLELQPRGTGEGGARSFTCLSHSGRPDYCCALVPQAGGNPRLFDGPPGRTPVGASLDGGDQGRCSHRSQSSALRTKQRPMTLTESQSATVPVSGERRSGRGARSPALTRAPAPNPFTNTCSHLGLEEHSPPLAPASPCRRTREAGVGRRIGAQPCSAGHAAWRGGAVLLGGLGMKSTQEKLTGRKDRPT